MCIYVAQCVTVCCSVLQVVAIHPATPAKCLHFLSQHLIRTAILSLNIKQWLHSTGWRRRLIGSPKLQIIFHKRATKYKSLLRKMTYKDKPEGSYESSPPCNIFGFCTKNISRYALYKYVFTYTTEIYIYIYICRDFSRYIHRYIHPSGDWSFFFLSFLS